MSFTIQKVLIPVEQGYETQDVQIEGDKIAAIASELPVSGTVIDGENKLLLPGFFNAHTHSSEMWQRGIIPPVPLELRRLSEIIVRPCVVGSVVLHGLSLLTV